jgi:hypothetical protein
MTEIEVKNKINFRNIAILFVIGVFGVINGVRDFSLFKTDISKILFPDPVTYHNVVEMNNSMINTMALNSMSFASLSILIIGVVILCTVIFSFAGIMGGRGD